jgi:fluoroacetyl-CoA thioesterase
MNRLNLKWDVPDIKPGLSRTIQRQITKADILGFGSGADVIRELIPFPTLTALMIEGVISTIDPLLPEGYVTVGTSTAITYLNTVFLGSTITVLATLTDIDGRKLTFECMAFDELGQVGRGTHERRIVNPERLMKAAHKRCEQLKNIMK